MQTLETVPQGEIPTPDISHYLANADVFKFKQCIMPHYLKHLPPDVAFKTWELLRDDLGLTDQLRPQNPIHPLDKAAFLWAEHYLQTSLAALGAQINLEPITGVTTHTATDDTPKHIYPWHEAPDWADGAYTNREGQAFWIAETGYWGLCKTQFIGMYQFDDWTKSFEARPLTPQ